MVYRLEGKCWHCGHALSSAEYAREARCPHCQKATHVCRNCRWYAPSAPAQCREPTADPVADKTRPNFCGYFEATDSHHGETSDPQALRDAADDLFDL